MTEDELHTWVAEQCAALRERHPMTEELARQLAEAVEGLSK